MPGVTGVMPLTMSRMFQGDEPNDYVVATGEMHSVWEFCVVAFSHAGLNYEDHVVMNPIYLRAAEVNALCGDASKAREKLVWNPNAFQRPGDHDG